MEIQKRLGECKDFGCIFNLVRESVDMVLKKRRAGMMLALQHLPEYIGAFYPVGTNFIVMNKTLLAKIYTTTDNKTTKSYVFYVLLHEYLHSLGFLNERDVLGLSHHICKMVFGKDHTSTKIARNGIGSVIPKTDFIIKPRSDLEDIEIIDNFDEDETSYIG